MDRIVILLSIRALQVVGRVIIHDSTKPLRVAFKCYCRCEQHIQVLTAHHVTMMYIRCYC